MTRPTRSQRREESNFTPLAWLIATMLLIGAALGLSVAPDAGAVTSYQFVQVTTVWDGGDPCNNTMTGPVPGGVGFRAPSVCANFTSEIQKVYPGQVYGVNPIMGDAAAVGCSVVNVTSGAVLASDYGVAGDGFDVNCLRTWI